MAFSANLQKLRVTLAVKSGITRDFIVNDFHYTRPAVVTDTDYDAMQSHIQDFYDTVATGGVTSVGAKLSNEIKTTALAHRIDFYDVPVGGGAIGAPVASREFTIGTVSTSGLPEECAAVLGFRAEYGTDVEFGSGTRPRSRDRNRIFLGPLSQNTVSQDGTTQRVYLVDNLIQSALASAIQYLYTEPFADGWLWRVVSRAGNVDKPVAYVDMDNAFDSQRRRGTDALAKTEAAVA